MVHIKVFMAYVFHSFHRNFHVVFHWKYAPGFTPSEQIIFIFCCTLSFTHGNLWHLSHDTGNSSIWVLVKISSCMPFQRKKLNKGFQKTGEENHTPFCKSHKCLALKITVNLICLQVFIFETLFKCILGGLHGQLV